MKDKQNGKKLTVRKLTIANLDKVTQSHVKGGLQKAGRATEDTYCNSGFLHCGSVCSYCQTITCPANCD